MFRYDEIINDSDLVECNPGNAQFESKSRTHELGVYSLDLMDV